MSKIFIISDTHFNHSMVIREKKRDFKSVKEMNKTIIDNWNKAVSDDDIVFHLGDVAMSQKLEYFKKILPILKGKIIFVRGNHDNQKISNITAIKVIYKGKSFELVHDPLTATFSTDYIIHGHIHEFTKKITTLKGKRCYNCVVELQKYKPKLLSEILGELEKYEHENRGMFGDKL